MIGVRALQSFADGKVEALVATDVAARGIHVEGVACVLHFDPPIDHKTYVHRSGRTARAGAQGVVVSFVDGDQLREADALVRDLQLRANLSTPAPASLQAAIERLSADPDTSFADIALALADAEDLRRRRPHAGATAEPPSGRRRCNNGSRARGSVAAVRCQRVTVSGCTITRVERQPGQYRESDDQKRRSAGFVRVRAR